MFKFLSAPKRYISKRFKLRKTVADKPSEWRHIIVNVSDKGKSIYVDGKLVYIEDKPEEPSRKKARG